MFDRSLSLFGFSSFSLIASLRPPHPHNSGDLHLVCLCGISTVFTSEINPPAVGKKHKNESGLTPINSCQEEEEEEKEEKEG